MPQKVMWTVVPNGIDGTNAKLVAIAHPRLSGTGAMTVSTFPEWVNWAEQAAKLTFKVRMDTSVPVPATRTSPAPEPKVWTALVSRNLPVRSFEFVDHSKYYVNSYSVGPIVEMFRKEYGRIAVASPSVYPTVPQLAAGPVAKADLYLWDPARYLTLAGRFTRDLNRGAPPALDPGNQDSAAIAMIHADSFHRPTPAPPRFAPRKAAAADDGAPGALDPDFHQLMSLLHQYPQLQRRLGLVFDLTVPLSAFQGAMPWVSLFPVGTPAAVENTTPATQFELTGGGFRPVPGSSDLVRDMLPLGTPQTYQVVTVDTDGAVRKAVQFSRSLHKLQTPSAHDAPSQTALPALRTGGLGLAMSGRALKLAQRFKDAKQLNDGAVHGLDAARLLYGLRWDVWDMESERWYSLCSRTGRYTFLNDRSLDMTHTDMGAVTTATSVLDGDWFDDHVLSEFLMRWEGESLVAGRRGKALDRDPSKPPADPANDTHPNIPLKVDFQPEKGTLPPLRFGRMYRLRASAVYLGGAGPAFNRDDTDTSQDVVTQAVQFCRLEPVPPPVVALRKPPVAGESVHTIVIRSDFDTDPAQTVPSERHVLPPKGSQQLAERSGLFDTPTGLDRNAYATIVARAGGSLEQAGTPVPSDPRQRYHDVDKLSFPVENGGTAEVPWLVDTFSDGAALHGLPTAPNGAIANFGYNFGYTWRNPQAFRLRVVEGTAEPIYDRETSTLTVSIGKGDIAETKLSSTIPWLHVAWLEVWSWIAAEASRVGQSASDHHSLAMRGLHWVLTPPQPLRIVHAVRRPLIAPRFFSQQLSRELARTNVRVNLALDISRKSTAKMDVDAQWADPVDTLDAGGWQPRQMVTRTSQLRATPVGFADAQHSEGQILLGLDHELGDTATHAVRYTATATSRFTGHFPEFSTKTAAPTGTNWVVIDAEGLAPGSVTVTKTGGTTPYAAGSDYELDLRGGRLRCAASGTIPSGTGLTVTFKRSFSRSTTGDVIHVPSSARPAPPKPLYVLPTFAWASSIAADRVSRDRLGGGLRVYLDRPWWSSGDGEQLGVVVWTKVPAGATEVDEAIKPYVTQWGSDPLYGMTSGGVTGLVPALNQFSAATSTVDGIALAETGQLVGIAAHDVKADLKRRLWYCDIELSPGWDHQPFVRLALVRYQPRSLKGAEISPVVLADYAQLASDRSASVTFPTEKKMVVAVSGKSGSTRADNEVSTVEIALHRRTPGVPGDLGWTEIGGRKILPEVKGMPTATKAWRGEYGIPVARGSEPLRLVIREYDVINGAQRLTYTDVINL